jgi:hypothetical protein
MVKQHSVTGFEPKLTPMGIAVSLLHQLFIITSSNLHQNIDFHRNEIPRIDLIKKITIYIAARFWIQTGLCKVLLQKQVIGIKSKASLQIDK